MLQFELVRCDNCHERVFLKDTQSIFEGDEQRKTVCNDCARKQADIVAERYRMTGLGNSS